MESTAKDFGGGGSLTNRRGGLYRSVGFVVLWVMRIAFVWGHLRGFLAPARHHRCSKTSNAARLWQPLSH
jgi:hypothetical protein